MLQLNLRQVGSGETNPILKVAMQQIQPCYSCMKIQMHHNDNMINCCLCFSQEHKNCNKFDLVNYEHGNSFGITI